MKFMNQDKVEIDVLKLNYEEFNSHLIKEFPLMFPELVEISVSPGWRTIILELCEVTQSYITWRNSSRKLLLEDNPYNHSIPEEVSQVKVGQIKEKFGGLRFYFDGGDRYVAGAVRMAEAWASQICEQCGAPGTRRTGGWIQTLCATHDAERKAQHNLANAHYNNL
jgi:hypothetical protein